MAILGATLDGGRMAPDVTADNSDNDAGLVVFRASRLEALVPPLRSMLQQTRPDSVLAPQTVVAAHPGMKQWLTGALARAAGPSGIVANLEVILPSTWLDRVAGERLGAQAVKLPAWQRAHLRWTVHDLLRPGHAVPGLTDARIERYDVTVAHFESLHPHDAVARVTGRNAPREG